MKLLRTSDGKILRAEPVPSNTGYSALYNWYAATYSTGGASIAPSGWHVPSKTELETLQNYVGGETNGGGKLKETGTTHWQTPNSNATNEFGFNAIGSGSRLSTGQPTYLNQNNIIYATTLSGNNTYTMQMVYNAAWVLVNANNYPSKVNGNSIRCIKDDSTYVPYVDDIDGNRYPVVKIGNQVWMAANLQVTHYNDGTAIPNVTSNTDWANLTSGAYCIYNNDTQYISNIQGKSKILRVETA